jgi:hypothetical protein
MFGSLGSSLASMLIGMFAVSEAEAASIRAIYEQRGELSAAVELRRRFPGIASTAQAGEYARIIADWKPLPKRPTELMHWRKRTDDGAGLPPRAAPFHHRMAIAAAAPAITTPLPRFTSRTDLVELKSWRARLARRA